MDFWQMFWTMLPAFIAGYWIGALVEARNSHWSPKESDDAR